MEQPPNHRPIIIDPYDPNWPWSFEHESRHIRLICQPLRIDLEHIGSTAVPNLAAKPTIDMMLSVANETEAGQCIVNMKEIGYCHVPGFFWKLPGRFDVVYKDISGNRAFNIHIVGNDGIFAHRHITFRDYLRKHADARQEYEALKRELAARFKTDMDAYASAKDEFVASILQKAKEENQASTRM